MNIFIINPIAGNKKNIELVQTLNNLENSMVYVTIEPKDATKFTAYITKKYPNSIIYSIGEDGTLNQ